MKKGIVLLLALVFVFAFAAVAYAASPDTWNPPGPTYNNTLAGATPHGGYAATGDECEICHSPHRAGTAGSTYKLLRGGSAADACDYCHNGATGAAAGYLVYEVGGADARTGQNGHEIEAFTNVPDETDGAIALVGTSLDCFDCHTVHGAGRLNWSGTSVNGVTLDAASEAILKADANGDSTAATTVTGFCAECHNLNYDTSYAASDITHYMGAANAVASPRGAAAVADATSADCIDCHVDDVEATTGVDDWSWPHVSYAEGLMNLDTDGTHNNSAAVTRSTMDANCLMCHSTVGSAY